MTSIDDNTGPALCILGGGDSSSQHSRHGSKVGCASAICIARARPLTPTSMWVFLLLGVEAMRTYKVNPSFVIGPYSIPTWTTPLLLVICVKALVPGTSFLGHLCGLAVGYLCRSRPFPALSFLPLLSNTNSNGTGGLGYLKFLAPPEKALRWIEGKLNLLGRLPHYVSVDQKTYGRFGVLPTTGAPSASPAVPSGIVGSTQRLGP